MTFFFRRPNHGRAASFDLATLLELFDGDRAAIGALLEAALTAIRGEIDAIGAAALAGDAHAVSEAAHKLTGTGGTIGATRLVTLTGRLAANGAELPADIDRTIAALRVAFFELEAEIAASTVDA